MIARELVATALLDKLTAALEEDLVTIGRKHRMPPDLSPDQQPALFVCATANGKTNRPGTPGKRTMTFHLFLYCCDDSADEPAGEETSVLETTINDLLDKIEAALAVEEWSQRQTLNGAVEHCWIEGDVPIDPGVFGKQGFAIIPVSVLLP